MFDIFTLKIVLWIILIVPWLTIFFMKKESIKRYMPVSLFGALLVTIWNEMAYTFKWWEFKTKLVPSVVTGVPFVYGAFFVGTLWIFYFTYRSFWLFLVTNMAIDALLAFPMNSLFQQMGLYHLGNGYTGWKIFLTSVVLAVVFYLYQLWQEEVLVKPLPKEGESNDLQIHTKNWFRTKQKAR